MMEFNAPEEDGGLFEPNGHEPGVSLSPNPSSTSDIPEPSSLFKGQAGQQSVPPVQAADEADEQDDTDLIQEVLDELSSSQRLRRQNNRLAEQAAGLVARYGSRTSADSIFRDVAVQSPKDRKTNPGRTERRAHGWLDQPVPSTAPGSSPGLVKAIFKAASQAGSEREAGLYAALSVPLMIQKHPELWPAIPALSAGMDVLARFLHRLEIHRSLLLELPKVLRATLDRLAWYASQQRLLTARLVSTVLAEQTGIWLVARTQRTTRGGRTYTNRPSADLAEDEEED